MVRIEHTRDTASTYVFCQRWAFSAGKRVIDVPIDEAAEAVDLHAELQFVADPPVPTDWETLRKCAKAADDDAVDGNSSKDDIAEWLDRLDDDARAEVLDSVDMA